MPGLSDLELNSRATCERLVTHLVQMGHTEKANAVINCERYGRDNVHYRCSVPHCPDYERYRASQRSQKLIRSWNETESEHPRMGLYKLTATMHDVEAANVGDVSRLLGSGMRRFVKDVRAYKGSYWQTEIVPARMDGDHLSVHPHVHASIMLPAKGKPDFEDVNALWYHLMGRNARPVQEWGPVIWNDHPPTQWLRYSSKAEKLSGFSQADFNAIIKGLKGKQVRGWVN